MKSDDRSRLELADAFSRRISETRRQPESSEPSHDEAHSQTWHRGGRIAGETGEAGRSSL